MLLAVSTLTKALILAGAAAIWLFVRIWNARRAGPVVSVYDDPELRQKLDKGVRSLAQVPENLRRMIQPHLVDAWAPVVVEGGRGASKFGGRPWLRAKDEWPRCPECGKGLRLLVQLELMTLPRGHPIRGRGLLQHFACERRTCSPIRGTHTRRIDTAGAAVASKRSSEGDDWPVYQIVHWMRFQDLPDYSDYTPLGIDIDVGKSEHYALETDAGYAVAANGDKLGGYRDWIQDQRPPPCPTCGKPLAFVFQLDDLSEHNGLEGAGIGSIHQCPDHPDELAYHYDCS